MKKAIGAVTAIVLIGLTASIARANFTLTGSQQMTVNTQHTSGKLYDQSEVTILSGGAVTRIYAYDTSSVNMSGGQSGGIHTYNTSTAHMSDGQVTMFFAHDTCNAYMSGGNAQHFRAYGAATAYLSNGEAGGFYAVETGTAYMSGGQANNIYAHESGTMYVSGGQANSLYAYNLSKTTFIAQEFSLGTGLSVDGNRLRGTGSLSGRWLDGEPWTIYIRNNNADATVLLTPEPATLSLLALGGLMILRRRRNH
ncbi:MAG: PEP-CTERM sorting domain-containing protein [Phycisphaerae bacterium]|jgi:hypothetical protein|nr:PEP-CTERM sorting domain-containing protein [Phycisphaerae bacterium]